MSKAVGREAIPVFLRQNIFDLGGITERDLENVSTMNFASKFRSGYISDERYWYNRTHYEKDVTSQLLKACTGLKELYLDLYCDLEIDDWMDVLEPIEKVPLEGVDFPRLKRVYANIQPDRFKDFGPEERGKVQQWVVSWFRAGTQFTWVSWELDNTLEGYGYGLEFDPEFDP